MTLRYYLYVSEPKVEMLLAQIDPAGRKKVTSEFGINFKVVSAKRTQESSRLDDLYQRVAAVSWYIENYGSYGSIDEPDQFFGGVASLRWGPFIQPDPPLSTSVATRNGRFSGLAVRAGTSSAVPYPTT